MKNQPSVPQPIPPAPTPITPVKPAFPWGIVVLVIVVIAVSVGTTLFLVRGSSLPFLSQTKPTLPVPKTGITNTPTNVVSSPVPVTISPTNALACDVSDNTFCKVLADLKAALSAKNYAGFLAYQNLQSVTCDPDGMFVSICEGEAKGTVKQGYGLGYNQSEGIMVNKNDYVTSVLGYVNSHGPFIYRGSLVSGNKGVAVFLNAKKDYLLVFPLKRTAGTWLMNSLLLGGTFADNSFDSLSNSLLDFVQ